MTTMIRVLQAERESDRESERRRSNVVGLQPMSPPMAYRLQTVVWVADRGWGVQPRYAVELEDVDGGYSGIEWEGDDSIECLEAALRVVGENEYHRRKRGLRIEFVGWTTL